MEPTRLSNEQCLRRVRYGGTLIVSDLPDASLVALDLREYTTAPRFRGFKAIPPDVPHLLHYTPRGVVAAGRLGVPLLFSVGEIVCLHYDAAAATLERDDDPARVRALVAAAKNMELDYALAMYPPEMEAEWNALVLHISKDTLSSCGLRYFHNFSSQDPTQGSPLASPVPAAPPAVAVGTIQFVPPLPCRGPMHMTPAEITKYNLDKSQQLRAVLDMRYAGSTDALLGDLQLSFLLFSLSYSIGALEQWKRLVALLCGCDDAVRTESRVFVAFTQILCAQLALAGEELLAGADAQGGDGVSAGVLEDAVASLCETAAEGADIPSEVVQAVGALRELVESKLGWSVDELISARRDEDGPVVVVGIEEEENIPMADEASTVGHLQSEDFRHRRKLLEDALDNA